LGVGNTLYFGDPMMTPLQYLLSIAGGALLGGSVNGITALSNGRSFWSGNLPSSNAPIVPTITQPTLNQQNNNVQPSQSTTQTPAERMSQVREMGRVAEEAVGIDQMAKRPIESLSKTANFRIPDRLTTTTLEEVKNVSHLEYTNQLKDFVNYSQQTNRQMILWVRPAGTIYGPATIPSLVLQNMHNQGMIKILSIPF